MSTRTYIIAEAGVNHNGSLDMAKQLIDAAKQAGADAVKFQTFRADKLVTADAAKAEYQARETGAAESQYDMLKKLELTDSDHQILADYCRQREIAFLSTPFDTDSLEWLIRQLEIPAIKISSGDITNGPFLHQAARSGLPIILSTGMSSLSDIETALGILAHGLLHQTEPSSSEEVKQAWGSEEGRRMLQDQVTLLHCTSEYPTPPQDIHLNVLSTLRNAFGTAVGLSDHSEGIAIPIAAAALGATVIEKHFTLDRHLPGPDHQASLEPDELRQMVEGIRQVEAGLGRSQKIPVTSELKNRPVVRKSIVAAQAIEAGDVFTRDNLAIKRPGTGLSPVHYWDLLGKKADRSYRKDERIVP